MNLPQSRPRSCSGRRRARLIPEPRPTIFASTTFPTASPPTGALAAKDWLAAATARLEPGELDRLVNAELAKAKITPASRTTDEQFLRRV